MCATSWMSRSTLRSGCTTIARARSSGTAGAGTSSAVARQRTIPTRRISEQHREGRLDTRRGLLGAMIGEEILALQDHERPGLVGEAEHADVDRRVRRSLVVVLVARDRVDPGQHLGHRLQVEAPLASGTVRRLLERELAPQLERAATPERVEAGQVAPAPLVSGRGSASFALAGQRGEGQVRAGDGPPPETRILHAA